MTIQQAIDFLKVVEKEESEGLSVSDFITCLESAITDGGYDHRDCKHDHRNGAGYAKAEDCEPTHIGFNPDTEVTDWNWFLETQE